MTNGSADPKIVDLIKKRDASSKPFVSIEFFPPRTEKGVEVRNDFCLFFGMVVSS